jgi:hypothetical protein
VVFIYYVSSFSTFNDFIFRMLFCAATNIEADAVSLEAGATQRRYGAMY